jgi:dTDP-4-dehydrorhamnose 3,5-epimerase
MKATNTAIDGLLLLEPDVHKDARGHFVVTWSQDDFDEVVGRPVQFVQDNCSQSWHAVLRGLHYQVGPHAQGRLVQVLYGTVFDVAVDMRRTSLTYGCWVGTELSDTNHRMAWLPPGLAHGFLVLSSSAVFAYKTTARYDPQAERCIRWNDPTLAIAWPDIGKPPILNDRDALAPQLSRD